MVENRELPTAGSTSPPAWRPTTTESPGTVSMAEALETWRLSERTLRRRLTAGEVAGAHKVPTSKGEEWRIPADALDALGYDRHAGEAAPAADPVPGLDVAELLQELRADRQAWRDLAKESRLELTAAENDRVAAHTKAARLELELAAEKERADALAAELAEARKPRRRWGRKGQG